jgi:uncharacterized protein YigA (DUF484 family)
VKQWLIAVIDRIRRPAERDAQLARMQSLLATSAAQNLELARKFHELQRRLQHHERGPLKTSAEQMNGARKSGLILPGQPRS